MTPHQLLGINADASVIEVKRAYAKKLKTTRPDDDPVAFQTLQEAYAHCLEWAQHRNEQDDAVPMDDVAPHHDADDTREAVFVPNADELDGFDDTEQNDQAFLQDFTDRFIRDEPMSMLRWLNAHPAMVSIRRKDAIRWDILDAIEGVYPPVSEEMLDVVKRFFGLDQWDFRAPWLIERLTAIEGEFDNARALQSLKQHYNDPGTKYFDRLLYRELCSPFHPGRRGFCMLMFGMPQRLSELCTRIENIDPSAAHNLLNAKSVAFWRAANAHSRLAWQRLVVVAMRIVFWVPLASFPAFKNASLSTLTSAMFWRVITGNMLVWAVVWAIFAVIRLSTIRFKRFRLRNN